MARPRIVPGALPTEIRIIDAAERAFGARGYAPARLADIASDVGIRRPSLLYHFGTKEALYRVVVDRLFNDLRARLVEAALEGGNQPRLDAITSAFLDFLEARPAFAQVVTRGMMDDDGPVAIALRDELVPLLDEVIALLKTPGDEQDMRPAVVQIAAAALLRAAAAPTLRSALWGDAAETRALARRLLGG